MAVIPAGCRNPAPWMAISQPQLRYHANHLRQRGLPRTDPHRPGKGLPNLWAGHRVGSQRAFAATAPRTDSAQNSTANSLPMTAVLAPTMSRPQSPTVTLLAPGHVRHTTALCETGRARPVSTRRWHSPCGVVWQLSDGSRSSVTKGYRDRNNARDFVVWPERCTYSGPAWHRLAGRR